MNPLKAFGGAAAGLLVVYLFGALVAWSFDPADWWTVWRLWCALWAVIWVVGGAVVCGDAS